MITVGLQCVISNLGLKLQYDLILNSNIFCVYSANYLFTMFKDSICHHTFRHVTYINHCELPFRFTASTVCSKNLGEDLSFSYSKPEWSHKCEGFFVVVVFLGFFFCIFEAICHFCIILVLIYLYLSWHWPLICNIHLRPHISGALRHCPDLSLSYVLFIIDIQGQVVVNLP